jgi:hypothetical protein
MDIRRCRCAAKCAGAAVPTQLEKAMFRAAGIAAAVLSFVATLALAQGASAATDASPASSTSAPAIAPASAFTNDQKGVKRTSNPSAGQVGIVTPGGGATAQSGQAFGQESMQRGSGANSKPHSNSGGGDRAEADAATDSTANRGKPTKEQKTYNESRSNNTRTTSPINNSGSGRAPGAAVTPGTPAGDSSGNKSFFESRSNTARTPDSAAVTDDAAGQRASKKINTSKSNLRTGNAPAEAAGKPAPAEAAAGSTSSIFK